jgi:Flp pilus assembly protein TadD
LWFLGTLVPAIGIVQVGFPAMADRFTYVPLVGLFIVIVWGAADVLERQAWTKAKWASIAGAATVGAVLAALTWRTIDQTRIWSDSERLFTHAIRLAPNNPGAQTHLALVHLNRNQVDKAIAVLHDTLRYHPDLAEAHTTLGVAYRRIGDSAGAIYHHRQAIRIKPDSPAPHANLGIALFYDGRFEDAEVELRRALELDADFANAHAFLGIVLSERGQWDEAAKHLARAIELQPDHAQAMAALERLRRADPKQKAAPGG